MSNTQACTELTLHDFFFFQAEDGIRDLTVTGVQTCALPISFPYGTAPRDLYSGSGLTANRINQLNASGLYPAFDVSSCSPRPAFCYRPLLNPPSVTLQCRR